MKKLSLIFKQLQPLKVVIAMVGEIGKLKLLIGNMMINFNFQKNKPLHFMQYFFFLV